MAKEPNIHLHNIHNWSN